MKSNMTDDEINSIMQERFKHFKKNNPNFKNRQAYTHEQLEKIVIGKIGRGSVYKIKASSLIRFEG